MFLLLARPEEMDDVFTAGMQELCDQAPVAPPPEGFRAHEAGSGLRQGHGKRRLPARCGHACGVAAKRSDAKTPEIVLSRLIDEAAAKSQHVPIRDPALLEPESESWLIELGIVARAGKASHIDDCENAGRADNRHELFDDPSPMPDCPDGHRSRIGLDGLDVDLTWMSRDGMHVCPDIEQDAAGTQRVRHRTRTTGQLGSMAQVRFAQIVGVDADLKL